MRSSMKPAERGRPMIALISVGDLQRLNHSAQMIQLDVISSSYLVGRTRRDMNRGRMVKNINRRK